MIEQGVDSRWSMLVAAALALGGMSGCISASDDAKASEAAAQASVSSAAPEQVVRSNRPDPARIRPSAAASSADVERLPTAAVDRAAATPSPRARSSEPITPRHLEAELNRLEAELGR